MTMPEPITKAGKRLFRGLYQATPDDIARIEAEAAAAERERITAAVKGMPLPVGPHFEGIELHPEIIAAVLAIVNPEAADV